MGDININTLLESCRLLFEQPAEISVQFLNYLKPEGLKAAYRERIKATHPDRARALGRREEQLTHQSQRINRAYETLLPYIADKRKISPLPRGPGVRKPDQQLDRDHYYRGPLPSKQLRFAMYLYYRGIVSWKTMIDALMWQRRVRPLIGQLALRWNFIELSDIARIISNCRYNETFGRAAVRLNLLSEYHLASLLGKQASYDCKIGRFFEERDIVSQIALERYLAEFRRHNLKFYGQG